MKFWLALLFAMPLSAVAHIGSPNVFYEGLAGRYALRVVIRPPDVIPGRAQITVRALDGNVQKVSVLPARWDTGTRGAPAPDAALPVRGETNLFATELWLMNSGAYNIIVHAEGAAGQGTTVVPVNSIATARRDMPRWFGTMLGTWAAALVIGMVCLFGAAARESVLPPGQVPSRKRVWLGRGAMALGAGILTLGLWGGKAWWDSVDRDYRNNRLYRADDLRATLTTNDAQLLLRLQRSPGRQSGRPLAPEHGKWMHAFIVRQPDLDAFAHLHPVRQSDQKFETALPPLPAGQYRIYADITHESGFTQTLVADVELPEHPPATAQRALLDPDDSWAVSDKVQMPFALPKGFAMHHVGAADARLQFTVLDSQGRPAVLEPYMEMQAHAVVHSRDGGVFTHLHPFGTVSMTSQQLFAKRERERFGKPFEVVCGLPAKPDVISFPYEFPRPGAYRIWVQVKIGGQIMTGVFDTTVPEA